MIRSIHITNFQSHPFTELEFHEGVNVIIGSSDSGKTAILRALNWVVRNRPSGESFRSHWGGDTNVVVKTKDGNIGRLRRKNLNSYMTLEMKGGEDFLALEFSAVGKGVPEEISSILNMNDVNIQSQMDSPFLLSESPAEVARVLNHVASLEDIDRAHQGIGSLTRKNNAELVHKKSNLGNLEEDLEEFSFLDEMEVRVENLEKRERGINSLDQDRYQLEGMIQDLEDLEHKREEINRVAKLKRKVDEILERGKEIKRKEGEMEEFRGIFASLSRFTTRRKEVEEQIERWRETFNELMPEQCPLCGREGGVRWNR